jgi:hypothetical protein
VSPGNKSALPGDALNLTLCGPELLTGTVQRRNMLLAHSAGGRGPRTCIISRHVSCNPIFTLNHGTFS